MTGQLCTVLAGCMFAMLLGTSNARALGGRITFTGAIVEPTCAARIASIGAGAVMSADHAHAAMPHRFKCGSTQLTTDSGGFYSLTVVNLDAATIDHDRVLEYFAGYVKAEGNNPTARLVTQTYE